MKKIILRMMLSICAVSSHSTTTVVDNPFNTDVKVDHPLFAKGAGGAQCKGFLVFVPK